MAVLASWITVAVQCLTMPWHLSVRPPLVNPGLGLVHWNVLHGIGQKVRFLRGFRYALTICKFGVKRMQNNASLNDSAAIESELKVLIVWPDP